MIQVLGLRMRHDTRTPGAARKMQHAHFTKGWRFASIQDVFDTTKLNALIATIPEAERYNLYFTVADCFEDTARKLKEQKAIPFDIDHIHINSEETVIADAWAVVNAACEALDVNPLEVGATFSGNGVQIFIPTTYTIRDENYFEETRQFYKAICDKIQMHLDRAAVQGKVDNSVWSAARLMRLPNTWNVKENKPKRMARILNGTLVPIDFELQARSGLENVTKAQTVAPEILKLYPKPDSPAVLGGCEFLKHAAQNAHRISEPEWYAAISIWSRLENGRELCHQMSEPHESYSYEETDMKIDQALHAAGPRTCKDIETRWDGCKLCANYEKCASPIMIRGPDFLVSRDFGFRKMGQDSSGAPKEGKPHYQDLVKYFASLYPFITLDTGVVMTYNGTHWGEMRDSYINEWLMNTVRSHPTTAEMQEFLGVLKAHNIRTHSDLAAHSKGKLNFKNCTLNTQTMEVTSHKKEDGFLYVLPFNYDPDARAPRWEQFLQEVTAGDGELIQALKEFGGYAISGDPCWYHKGLFLLGDGANGKSVYAEMLATVVGSRNCSAIPLQDLKSEYARYDLHGKLFNYSGETSGGAMYDSEVFKALVSGDVIRGRQPHGKPLEFKNMAKIICLGNHPPRTPDHSYGLKRRFLIVPFNVQFKETDPTHDPFLVEKLQLEVAGICNSLLMAYLEAREKKAFITPKVSAAELETLMTEGSAAARFWEERVEVHPTFTDNGEGELKDELYAAYTMFCQENGERPHNSVWFWRESRKLVPRFSEREHRPTQGHRKLLGTTLNRGV